MVKGVWLKQILRMVLKVAKKAAPEAVREVGLKQAKRMVLELAQSAVLVEVEQSF
jgi:hypothetical protein